MPRTKKIQPPKASELIRHLLLSWLFSALLEYLFLPQSLQGMDQLDGIAAMSLPRLLTMTVIFTAVLWALSLRSSIALYERWGIALVFLLLTAAVLANTFSWALFAFCCLILAILIVYAIWGYDKNHTVAETPKKSHWAFPAITTLLALGFFAGVCVWTVCRVLTFSAPNYDFGIFSQMFYNMKETGLPMTTVERDGLLSHFAVHVSPIYYLMLPFYCLFPTPATLQVLQAAVITSAVIPMWLIGRHHGLSGLQRTLLCALLLFLPTTAGGAYYDLHENCFLLPLVLWLMYAIDKRNTWLILLFTLLTLMVKEDAAVYAAVAALYLIIRTAANYSKQYRKDLLTGIAMLILSVVWFLLVTGYLAEQGDGVMTYRYDNFMYDDSGSLLSVIKAVLLCPMKMLYECMDSEKLLYIAQTLIPLLGLPLLTRKYDQYLLLIPYILINLMSDYQYQHNVLFQYNFGSTAFLLYLTAVNLADLRWSFPRFMTLAAAVAVSIGFFCSLITPQITRYSELYSENKAYYASVSQALEQIPDDASVTAHTFYVVPLSQRSELYDIRYCSQEHLLSTEYVVLRSTSDADFKNYATNGNNGFENLISLLEQNGYEEYLTQGSLVIYHDPAN